MWAHGPHHFLIRLAQRKPVLRSWQASACLWILRQMSNPPTRRTQPVLKVRPLPDERVLLEANAAAANLPLSAYLLAAGLGATIKSVIDLEQVAVLAKTNADLGRLGGLLKLWLTMEERFVPSYPRHMEINQLLQRIQESQRVLHEAARNIVDHF